MDIAVYDDPADFWKVARPLYEADPARHTVAITVIRNLLEVPDPDAPPPLLVSVADGGETVGAAFRTPPWPLGVSAVPVHTTPALAEFLHVKGCAVSGVAGPCAQSDAFAQAWKERTGVSVTVAMNNRLYRLGELLPPDVAGELRLASEADVPLLSAFRKAFTAEAIGHIDDPTWREGELRKGMALGHAHGIWSVDGAPVAYAAASRPLNGMSRIGPVYTPPEHRHHGYGSAATAAMSQWALDAGAEQVLLFTDLANPTSNSIYQRIGYQSVDDYVEYSFE